MAKKILGIDRSRFVISAALAANVGITLVKAAAAYATGSAAMVSEAVHSCVDSGNELLLFLGLRLASRKPDAAHSFGYGKELYFWSFVVAVMVFALGGLVSISTGVMHLLSPKAVEHLAWSFLVLAASAVFEAISFVIAYRQFHRGKRPAGLFELCGENCDPVGFLIRRFFIQIPQ